VKIARASAAAGIDQRPAAGVDQRPRRRG
jgi:hypothetical protein